MADVCEAFVSSVYSVDYNKFVSIRVHSWFLMTCDYGFFHYIMVFFYSLII